jgi:high-affinity nickel-transport protein
MLSTFSALILGFILGMRHATDPDHVVAVTTIVGGQRSIARATGIGALWGIGHTVTILLVGGAILVFRLVIPPRLGLAMEFSVALMLIVLGVLSLTGRSAASALSPLRPVMVGFVHGLAGSAFVAMLVLGAIPSPVVGLLYLLVFGVGTVAGMSLITTMIAIPSAYSLAKFTNVQRYLQLASGAVSVGLGIFLAHDVGIVNGLFGANPTWDPH